MGTSVRPMGDVNRRGATPPQAAAARSTRSSRRLSAPVRKSAAALSASTSTSMPPTSNPTLDRLAPGRTLGEIARGTGMNVEHVSRIFNGKRIPRLRTAAKIADFLDITMDQLRQALSI